MDIEKNNISEIDRDEITRIAAEINAFYDRWNRPRSESKIQRPSENLALKEPCVEYRVSQSAPPPEEYARKYSRMERPKKKEAIPYSYSSCFIPPIPLEKTFVEQLFSLMESKGMTGPQVYKAANLDKSLFSKITADKNYSPSKETAISIALALSLNLKETKDLLERAGFTLSRSTMRDAAVEYCIMEKIFNVVKVNIILDELGCPPLSRVR